MFFFSLSLFLLYKRKYRMNQQYFLKEMLHIFTFIHILFFFLHPSIISKRLLLWKKQIFPSFLFLFLYLNQSHS